MAKEIRPWFRWHWQRYRTSKHVLDFCLSTNPAQAHGCYRLLLDAMWERGCVLPKNREILWTLAGCKSREQYEEVADAVEACFDETKDKSGFTSELLSDEWHSATALLEKKREAGKVGGKASAEARAQAPVKQNSTSAQASSSSSSSSSIKIKPTRETSNQEPADSDREEITRKIAKLHPELSHLHPHELPYNVVQEVAECIQTDGAEMVEKGVRLLADEMARKTKSEKQYCEDWQKKAYPYFKGRKYRPEVKIVKDTLTGNERCDCLDAGIDFEGKKPADIRVELQKRKARQA